MDKARKRAVTALGAALYALFAAFGAQAQRLAHVDARRALLVAAALFVPAYAALGVLLRRSAGPAARGVQRPFRAGRAFGIIFACYVPMLAVAWPGSFAYDVPFQLRQVFTGAYSTHHPLLHTLLLGGCVALGRALGSINLGAALYTVLQMAGLSGCFALTCASIARSCSPRAARRAAVCFALYPLHMCFAVNATKDVLFSGLFALTLALSLEAVVRERPGVGLCAGMALSGAGMALLRNNALYAVAVWTVPLLIILRRGGARVIACAALSCALCVAGNGALRAATGAQSGDMSEMLSLPIQQLARARGLADDRLTEEERAAIDALMPGEAWALYDPTISDPVKFRFDTRAFLSDTKGYVDVYLSVGRKCPDVYLDAALLHTFSFWYPYSAYRVSGPYLQMGVSAEQTEQWCDFEWIAQNGPFSRVLTAISWRLGAQGAMQFPAVGWLFNMGLIVWAMLFFVLREMYAGRWRRFAVAMLAVLLWGTFLLGPVMAGRYIYPFVCALPVLASRPKAVSAWRTGDPGTDAISAAPDA